VERSEWPDDDAVGAGDYPPAPLPPHERAWRHPSELGMATWTHSEPPLTIGRGLLVMTGAIGGLLSLAVLWAMLPTPGRGQFADPTVISSAADDLPSLTLSIRADTFVATSVDDRLPSTTLREGPLNAPPSQQNPTTSLSRPQATVSTQRATFVEAPPMAVGVGDSMVITTARAVHEGRTSITVIGADGQPHIATVERVDRDIGLAVLSFDAAVMTRSYGIGAAPAAGDVVTVQGATPTDANVIVDADGRLRLDKWTSSMAEGTPVVDADGLLVGMCSHGVSGAELVSVANVAAMLPAPKPAQPAPWLGGVHVVDGDGGAARIDDVDGNGPAAAVGITVGDIIVAVNGVAVSGVDQLKAAVAGNVANDIVTLTITHADQTSSDVKVTLGVAP
jgi:S1-C subfamily serine protease